MLVTFHYTPQTENDDDKIIDFFHIVLSPLNCLRLFWIKIINEGNDPCFEQ